VQTEAGAAAIKARQAGRKRSSVGEEGKKAEEINYSKSQVLLCFRSVSEGIMNMK
jgi:hypothetical protein